jgi:amino acid adenylation domain-containing protein
MRLVNRHEVFRTSFDRQDGLKFPVQVIRESGYADWAEVKWEGPQSGWITSLLEDERLAVAREGRLRVRLVGSGEANRLLVMSLPGLCGDGATLRQMVLELTAEYEDKAAAEEILQYADLAEVFNQLLEADDTDMGREFWRKPDYSALGQMTLPLLNEPGDKTTFDPRYLSLDISPDLYRRIEARSDEYQVSSEAFFLACWQTLLWRLNGGREIIIGVAADGRDNDEMSGAMGLVTRYLPVHGHLEGHILFSDLLAQSGKSLGTLIEWQEYFSWDQITSQIGNEDVFFPFAFDFEKQIAICNAGETVFTPVQQYTCTERFTVKLSVRQQGAGLNTQLQYDAGHVSLEMIQRLAAQLHQVIDSTVNTPDAPIARLDILGESERRKLLLEVNETKADYPQQCIHEMFERQAECTPNRPAIIFEGEQLTYRELNARSNRLARALRRKGVKADVLIGLYMDRSLEMIVALLGILKAGGAYVPLDPATPKARLSEQMAQIQAQALVTRGELLNDLPDFTGEIICLDRDQAKLNEEDESNLAPITDPQHLAYVIFTSGSTGSPKGIAITHRSLVNYANFICQSLRAGKPSADQGLHFATVSTLGADLGNTAIFPSLVSGGSLHIISYRVATDAEQFASYCSSYPIDVLKIVPSHLNALLSADEGKNLLPRRCLVLGGESFPMDLLNRLSCLPGDCQLINHYGPTETTVGSLTLNLKEQGVPTGATVSVPIGQPIANTEIYILDQALNPTPIGVPGELYIGGTGLARGYLNRPDLTAEKFIPNPFSGATTSRLYKTGDRARYLPSGDVECLGRVDQQVKIRGFRVELGEIEAVLMKFPTVKEAAVVAADDISGNKLLVAYLVSDQETSSLGHELRHFIKQRLPEYMAPSTYLKLEAMPLTINGKLDRSKLPAPDRHRAEDGSVFVAPSTSTQKKLSLIWTELFNREKISVYDNFFELGGDSILSIQVAAQSNRAGIRLTPLDIFTYPTIAELSEVLAGKEMTNTANGETADTTASAPARNHQPAGAEVLMTSDYRLIRLDQGKLNKIIGAASTA